MNRRNRNILIFVGVIAIILILILIVVKYINKTPEEKKLASIQSGDEDMNIILISVDTLRADHTSPYGYNIETPTFQRLSDEGTTLIRCRTPVPITLPGHASLLSGKYPPGHGVHVNMKLLADNGNLLLSEILQENGYQTSAFIASSVLGSEFGFNQGFDYFGDSNFTKQITSANKYRTADDIKEEVLDWFKNECHGKFFTFIHFYDPHFPYNPPEPFRDKYNDLYYDGEIAYVDKVIGEMLDELQKQGFLDNTLVILTSDHGEALGSKGIYGHTYFIYNNTLWVPAIFWYPGLIPTGVKIEGLTRLIDITPTILDILGFNISPEMEGESLVDYVIKDKEFNGLPCYYETYTNFTSFGWAKVFGIEKGDWKYILAPKPELYNITDDPLEETNLYSEHPDIVAELDSLLEKTLTESISKSVGEGTDVQLSDAVEKELMSLGYISSGEGLIESEEDIDPKDHIEFITIFRELMHTYGNEGEEENNETLLLEMIEMEPDVNVSYGMLEEYYITKDEVDTGIEHLNQYLDSHLNNYAVRNILARLYFTKRDYINMENELDIILSSNTENAIILAKTYFLKGLLYNDYYKDYIKALGYLENSMKLNLLIDRNLYYYAFMIANSNLRDFEKAKNYGTKHIELYPTDPRNKNIKKLLQSIN